MGGRQGVPNLPCPKETARNAAVMVHVSNDGGLAVKVE